MKKTILITTAIIALLLTHNAAFSIGKFIGEYKFQGQALGQQDMVALINKERRQEGLSELKQNAKLDESARLKACDMVERGYWGHQDPDGRLPWHLFAQVGYNYRFAGENLVDGIPDEEAMTMLMNSPKHRDNILSKNFTQVGIGRCGEYTVQHFATPQ